jgi:ferrous iron transport protein A
MSISRVVLKSEKPTPAKLTLDRLPRGVRAVVRDVEGPRRVVLRLMEMGLLPGTTVEILRTAPLGDPLELRLRGYALSLRREQARAIELEPLARDDGEELLEAAE